MELNNIYIGTESINSVYIGDVTVFSTTPANSLTLTTIKTGTFSIQLAGLGLTNISFGNGTTKSITLSPTLQTISTTFSDSTEKTITIDNASSITILDCNSMNVSSCDISKCTNLTEIVCYNNNINTLDFTNNTQIQYIHCFNNPLVTNDTNLLAMINTLPDRNNKAYGSIIIDNRTQMLKVEPTSIQKDWLFGSAIMYNATEWAKCGYHFKQLGVADIWESGDQGAGITIAVIDCGFDLTCQEYNSSYLKGVKNFSNQGSSTQVPLPTGGTPTHGNSTSTLIVAKGVKMYGIAPQMNYYLLKTSDISNICYTSWVSNAINYALQQGVDLISTSQSFAAGDNTLLTAIKNFCLANNKGYSGSPLVCSGGNTGDNNPATDDFRYPGAYKYPLAIGAINSSNILATWSSSYLGIDLVNYGVSITSQTTNSAYGTMSGTSFSTPITAGIVALLMKIFFKKMGRKPTATEIYEQLIKRTVSMGIDVRSCGVGRIQLMSYNANPAVVPQS